MMYRKTILGLMMIAGIAVVAAPSAAATANKPNLVVILADDLGYQDVGFNGCKDIPTPHIDSVAANGIKFTSAYVTYSVCAPSRAGFMTGRYPQRYGFERNPKHLPDDNTAGLALGETTLADSLGKIGYKSAMIGKWHLGTHPDLHPVNRGFDECYNTPGRYFANSYAVNTRPGKKPQTCDKYRTDACSDEAVSFIERHKDESFFLFLAYDAPHMPLQATEKYLSRFPEIKNEKRKTYAAMVSAVDDGVGRVLEALRKLKLEDNTLVIFFSDNGGPEHKNASNNGPLRGGKSDATEGGFRVPFALQWKGTLSAGVYDQPISSMDIFATMSALSHSPTDPNHPLDGVNLMPYLTGREKGAPHEAIYLRKFDQGRFAVRKGDYKLLINGKGLDANLYNLTEDIGEKTDLASQYPERLDELEKLRAAWASQLIEPVFEGSYISRKKK
ncbi:MAG: sulfatase-like hydrolase/transferase [Planctomycetota bacterium]